MFSPFKNFFSSGVSQIPIHRVPQILGGNYYTPQWSISGSVTLDLGCWPPLTWEGQLHFLCPSRTPAVSSDSALLGCLLLVWLQVPQAGSLGGPCQEQPGAAHWMPPLPPGTVPAVLCAFSHFDRSLEERRPWKHRSIWVVKSPNIVTKIRCRGRQGSRR